MRDVEPLLRGRSLVDRVVHRIGQDIVSNTYPVGMSLPNETEWCEKLDISRSVLREALRVLVSKNLVSIRARLGGRIRDRSEWNLLDPDILLWRSHGEDQRVFVAELFELRRIIEPAAAELAARRITEVQLEDLRRACREMEEAEEDGLRFLEPDSRFHRTILGAVGNSLFQGLSQTILVALDMTLRLSLNAPRGQQQSVPLHWTVLKELGGRNSAAARDAMLELIEASARDVEEAQALAAKAVQVSARPAR